MRIPMSCHDCTWEEIEAEERADEEAKARGESVPERRGGRPVNPDDWYLADIEEDNAYVEKCRKGHTMRMTLQHVRYELLYESGIVATLVGFHRESVASIAAALERFYEFAIEVFTRRSGIEEAVHEAAWKQVRKQSERQFGAFLFLSLVNFKRPFLSGKDVGVYDTRFGFRNDVIHQGRFPSATEAMDFARYVYDLIRDTRTLLKELDAEAVRTVELLHAFRGHRAVEAKAGPPEKGKDGLYRGAGSSFMPMMLNTMVAGAPTDFDSRLAESKENLWRWGFPTRS